MVVSEITVRMIDLLSASEYYVSASTFLEC